MMTALHRLGPLLVLLLGCASESAASQPERAEPPRPATSGATAPPFETGPNPTPLAPGSARTSVEGCLATRTAEEGRRFRPPPATRSGTPPPVTVMAAPGGIVLTHRLSHACCLRSETATEVKESTVVVTERLAGQACRCMCASTLRTSVVLLPGTWTVVVELDRGQGARRIHSQEFLVR